MRGAVAVYYRCGNEEHGLAKVVVGGHGVAEVPPRDLRLFMTSR